MSPFLGPFPVGLAVPQWQRFVLVGVSGVPAPTVTPNTALTCADVSRAQASFGGAAYAGFVLLSDASTRAEKIAASAIFRFILSSFNPQIRYFASDTSTRRFNARPLGVALSATGRVAPNPCGASSDTSTPCSFSQVTTDFARASESGWFSAASP